MKNTLNYLRTHCLCRIGMIPLLAILLLAAAILPLYPKTALAGTEQPVTIPWPAVLDAPGDLLTRIQCGPNYTATIYAENVDKPHGLALSPAGILYASESSLGRVIEVGATGTFTPVVTGLNNPEGLTFDDSGNLYVVEDIKGGRVVTRATNGLTGTLVTGLDAPEYIAWVDDGSPEGILYVTESNLEYAASNSITDTNEYRTHLTTILLSGVKTRILTTSAQVVSLFPLPVQLRFWSYSGVAAGPDDLLYVLNELSGQSITGTFGSIPFEASSTDSIYTADPDDNPVITTTFVNNSVIAPEGLSFSANGNFPLYVVEEDITGSAEGRLSQIDAAGNRTTFCTGFSVVEDVVVAQDGSFYVAEDVTDLIIRIQPAATGEPLSSVWLPVVLRS